MIKICKHCGKEFDFEKIQQFAAHVNNCKENPNRSERHRKISEKLKGKKRINGSLAVEYKVNCIKCEKEFIVKVTKEKFNKGIYKKYCSRACANSHVRTEESKNKTTISLKDFYNNPEGIKIKALQIQKGIETKIRRTSEGFIYKTWKKFEKKITCTYCKNEFVAIKNKSGYWPRLCSDECYHKTKTHNAKGIKRQEYNGQIFDSGWEVKVAKWLDENKINWIKPINAEQWVDKTGKQRKYFADFYLPEHNVYLDPKNKFCIQQQQEKLDVIEKQINLIYGTPEYIIEKISSYSRSKLRT